MIDSLRSLSSSLLSLVNPDDVAGPPPPDDPAAGEASPPELAGPEATGEPLPDATAGEPLPDPAAPADDATSLVPDWAHQFLTQYIPGQIDPALLQNAFPTGATTGANETTATEGASAVRPNTKVYGSEQEARQAIADKAIEYAGSGAHNEKEKYLDILAGKDALPYERKDMLSRSSCALFARGVLRESGCGSKYLAKFQAWPLNLDKPEGKKDINALVDVKRAAQEKDAWVGESNFNPAFPSCAPFPKTGDMVAIHDGDGKHEHMIVLTSDFRPDPNRPGDFLVNTVEGGQGNYTEKNDYSDAFGTPPGVARKRPKGQGDNEPRRFRMDGKGKLWTVNPKTNQLSKSIFGYANVGKMMGPYNG